MKRRERDNEARETSFLDIANCLMLLSHTHTNSHRIRSCAEFECKTCNRKFSSFQALGGHRASHKKPRLDDHDAELKPQAKPKMHECSICGLKFSLGQALGGHMRRHRAAGHDVVSQVAPVLKRSNSKRVLNLCLDLNLTPLENDLKLLFGNMHAS